MSTVVALSEFFAQNFPNVAWYPNWYLGNPYQYLIGPIVPALLSTFNSQLSTLNSYLVLIFTSFIIGAVGLYLFLKDWGVGKKQALISSLLYLLMPFGMLVLNYQNGLSHISFGFFPYILLFYRRFLASDPRRGSNTTALKTSLLITFALLIDISILLPIVIGFVSVFVSLKIKDEVEAKIIKTILILLSAFFLSSAWYTLGFWWVLLSNPSIGGIGLFNFIVSLLKLLLNVLPLVLAVLVVRWRKFGPASQGGPQGYLLFAVLFFSSFFFLSLVRFLLDPDFVMDWTGFLLELQFGGAIILGNIKYEILNIKNTRSTSSGQVYQKLKIFLFFFLVIGLLWLNGYIVSNLAIQQSYQMRIVSLINNNVKPTERIFLSGSSVFFINQFTNVQQVRGGKDEASIHPFWAHGAYQIREGKDGQLAYNWLKTLGASYILVHQNNSKDIFHDFKNTQKYADSPENFKQISADNGNILYKINDVSVVRLAEEKILSAQKPQNGGDQAALSLYTQTLKKPFEYEFKNGKIWLSGNIGQDQVISLAITYDSHFKITKGQGVLVKDAIGNVVIVPKIFGRQEFELSFKQDLLENIIPLILGFVTLILLINYHKIHPHVKKRLPSLHLDRGEDDY